MRLSWQCQCERGDCTCKYARSLFAKSKETLLILLLVLLGWLVGPCYIIRITVDYAALFHKHSAHSSNNFTNLVNCLSIASNLYRFVFNAKCAWMLE